MVGLALLQRKCLSLTMLSPGMHCRRPPSGRVAAPGLEAKFGRFSFGPSDTSGDRLALLLFRKREKRAKDGREGEGLCVPVSLVCINLNVCVCVFPLRGGSERNATVPLHMSTPPWAATGPVENRHAPMTNTHRHTHTRRLRSGRKYQTTPAEYLSRQRSKAAH